MRLASAEELRQAGVDGEGDYLLVFIANDKPNKAGMQEGGPFWIDPAGLPEIAQSAVGMPLLVTPDPTRHIRGATGEPEEILRIQKRYAVGEFVKAIVAASGNAWGVVKLFKEFAGKVKAAAAEGKLPPFVSPMVQIFESKNGRITKGRILHVQAVSTPGYSPSVAKIKAACTGMLGKCMDELKVLAAAGQLAEYRAQQFPDGDFADNSLFEKGPQDKSAMGLTDEDIAKIAAQTALVIEKKYPTIFAAAGEGEDPSGTEDGSAKGSTQTGALASVKGKEQPAAKPAGTSPQERSKEEQRTESERAKDPEIQRLNGEVERLKKEKQDAEAKATETARASLIKRIVEAEVQLGKVKKGKADDRTKHYQELKGEKATVGALELLLESLEEQTGRLVAAAGDDSEYAILSASGSDGSDSSVTDDQVIGAFAELAGGLRQ